MQKAGSMHAAVPARPAGPSVLKLVDHLKTVLEACATFAQCNPCDLSDAGIGSTRRAELTAITHLMQARECAHQAAFEDRRLIPSVTHFLAGTAALEQPASVSPYGLMLGRRLAATAAVQFAALLLGACDSLYLPRPPMPAAQRRQRPVHATAA